jgi:predicted dehydrogenase
MKEYVTGKENQVGLVTAAWVGGIPRVPWWRTWATSGGQIVEQNIHLFDQLRWLFGDVESVFRLMHLLDKLEERERKILEMRFGLRGGRPLTLEEVSQEIGRTRERVRQIQNQALTKLKQLLADETGFNYEG